MKMHARFSFLALGLAAIAAAVADEPISYAEGARLMAKYNCQTCHALDKKSAGPSLREIAKRYASVPTAAIQLESKVVNGSTGAWGPIPMPPSNVPQEDLQKLVEWTLSLR
jgi:cytochrome c